MVDDDASRDTAWETTTGRPDVTIAVLDSGIEWDNAGAMNNLRFKTRLTKAELPVPLHDRSHGASSTARTAATYTDAYDANGDHVFNIADYACDSRVDLTDPRRDGPAGTLTPQDVLIAFSDGSDADGNGYVDDIVGWDFLDNDNDPFDDVSYGHGTGEAEGSTSEADNGGAVGSCPNCMVIHMRVGDSFIADVNRYGAAVTYATDNDVQIVQSALGTLNNSTIAREATNYAYEHGTTVIVSAADEAAQHNNQPSLPHTILVNSVTRDATPAPEPVVRDVQRLHELQRQGDDLDPVDELLVGRGRGELRARRAGLLGCVQRPRARRARAEPAVRDRRRRPLRHHARPRFAS